MAASSAGAGPVGPGSVAGQVGRLGPLVGALVTAILDTPGATTPDLRRRAQDAATSDEPFGPYLAMVRRHAYRVVDEDINDLAKAGLGDDAVFELTVSAALGEAQRRLQIGLSLLER